MGVFTGTVAQILTGEELSGTDLATWYDVLAGITAAWTPWTPAWHASTTDPTLYTASGSYVQVGKTFFGLALLTVTGSTTAGTGNYQISMPPGITLASGNAWEGLGTMIFRDTSAGTMYGFNAGSISSTSIGASSNSTRWSASSPAVIGTGDTISIAFFGNCA